MSDLASGLEFLHPGLLLLLPLAALPLLSARREAIPFPWIEWLPQDVYGRRLHRLWQGTAALTIACLIVGLAGPMTATGQIERIGRGAEISILLDRSASMDSYIRRRIKKDYQEKQATQSKNDIARGALSWLFSQRPENRYALTLFHVVPMQISNFTSDLGILQAGLDASAIGRGAKETNMGTALLTAIAEFDQRPYTGSRAILLVSDGGAKLDKLTRSKIQQGLQRNQISLYFIYVQSGINNANFAQVDTIGTDTDALSDEITLHLFFKNLGTEYQVFEAHDEESMAEAVAVIDSQQNLPLTYYERTPGVDYSQLFFLAAFASCVGLTILAVMRLETLK